LKYEVVVISGQIVTEVLQVLDPDEQTIIFASDSNAITTLRNALRSQDQYPAVLSPGMTTEERNRNFYDFKRGRTNILLTLDVFIRGISMSADHIISTETVTLDGLVHQLGAATKHATLFLKPNQEEVMTLI
jgi:superfamily II DNA/RNA helicase